MSALAKLIGGIYIDQDLRAVLLMVGTLIVSWPLAGISYAYIEKPGIWLGRVAFDTVSGRVKIKSA
jgi:peptidoglycan/LPS O-acetylase OafA/YrhL